MEGENSLQWGLKSGAILYSSLTYKGTVIPLRTEELTYISSPGIVRLPGHWFELSGQSQCACRACKAPHENKAHKEKKQAGKTGWKV